MEKGTSFNGAAISARIKFHYHHSKLPRWIKKYFDITLEAQGTGYAEYQFNHTLGYGSLNIVQPSATTKPLALTDPKWDEEDAVWDYGKWDGKSLLTSTHKLGTSAENISILIKKNSDAWKPIRFTGGFLRFVKRRQMREDE